MKTPIKLVATALLLTLTVFSSLPVMSQDGYYADKSFATAMYPAQTESKLWLCLEQFRSDEKVNLDLINQQGQVLFHETVTGKAGKAGKRNAYRQQFDMSQLGDGKYTFRISSATHKEEHTFKLSTPTLEQTLPARLIAIK